jgi:hypothetical protein
LEEIASRDVGEYRKLSPEQKARFGAMVLEMLQSLAAKAA